MIGFRIVQRVNPWEFLCHIFDRSLYNMHNAEFDNLRSRIADAAPGRL